MNVHGRDFEKATFARVLRGAREGSGATLTLWGDPGIGKTALLEHAAATATGFTTLSCRGTRVEEPLAFAALHALLRPVADRIDALPAAQAAALGAALGRGGARPDRFLIAVATLTLLSELAAEQPLLITVDDAQWLDGPTTACLAYVARRLDREPVALLVATGQEAPTPGGPWDGGTALEIGGLDDTAAAAVVREASPHADAETVRRTLRAAGGNPLALRELPGSGAADGPEGRTAPVPLLHRAIAARVAQLAAPTRTLLLVAAAEDRGDHRAVRAAAALLGATEAAWQDALASGLLDIEGDRVRFHAPPVRTVVDDHAPPAECRRAHRALADVLTGEGRADLGAWHRAAAAEGPDDDVAAQLEECARQSGRRGGHASAVAGLRRAADLTTAPHGKGRRLALAARAAWEAGQVPAARDLLDQAERHASEEVVAGISGGLRGLIAHAHGGQESAHRLLLRDLRAVADRGRAVELACVAVRAAWSAGSGDRQTEALRVLAGLATDGDLPEAALLPALNQWWDTDRETSAAAPLTDDAVARLGTVSWPLLPPAPLALARGAETALADALRARLAALRATEPTGALVRTAPQTAPLDIARGHWTEATADATEALRVAEETGADHAASLCRAALARLAALRGETPAVTALTDRVLERSVPCGTRDLTATAYWARGQAALFAGRDTEALAWLRRLTEPGHAAAHPTLALLAAPDTAEAALRAGAEADARAALRPLRAWADGTGAAWAQAAADSTAALLTTDPDEAEALFRRALEASGAARRPFDHARTRLLYGEWLGRARRRTDALVQLVDAAETFHRLGAVPLLDRALAEQERAGERIRRPAPEPRGGPVLTPRAWQVARLAAEGLTDPEIAARLLLGPRTVHHLVTDALARLGVAARADLARVDFTDGTYAKTDGTYAKTDGTYPKADGTDPKPE
ncbi:Putative HTH-type transcriptional regulator [Streptomyces sp. YIM 121038]|uniref:AAA family ATPase n=1 Tax=Streptomyces sp. YIM 121038 TaxID=2136401 RepID=UPI0011655FC6|nr:LuxR family transcriptional regulator [Streptomyces sp. YIM 121038]QCX81779.1 Putative HTH-type transcriptional regulator [Streptomyces sp. YIM 121038]